MNNFRTTQTIAVAGWAFFMLTSSTFGQTLILANGKIIVGCAAATKYRDGELVKALNRNFDSYDSAREKRIAATLKNMASVKKHARILIAKAKGDQRRIIAVALTQYATGKLMERLLKKLPVDDKKQKTALNTVLKSSADLTVEAGNQFTGGNPDGVKLASNQVRALVKAVAQASIVLPPSVRLAVDIMEATIDATDVTLSYYGKELDKEVAKSEIKNVDKAVARLFKRSNAKAIALINKVKDEIDKACPN